MRSNLTILKDYFIKNIKTLPSTMRANLQSEGRSIYQVQHPSALYKARQMILAGEVIGVPTDTVYGLACDASNEIAIQKLYSVKGRDSCKPVAICVKDLFAVRLYGCSDHLSDALLNKLFPGPITIVIERSRQLSNRFLNPSTTKVGIRIPDSEFMQELCSLCHDKPLALTSANLSSKQSSLNIYEFRSLWSQLGGIFDIGHIGQTDDGRMGSTVIDLSIPGTYKVIRKGVALKHAMDALHKFRLKPIDVNI